ncbi:hypothetical protein WICPIJ_010083 [Wickerhamomyces pijperi]|uniref:Uncharacterized protein n=1 Tax=Wickerhamomyces pijperi TaxID=599730 RepID=A0A9P8TBJ4_WICPI|nr:hypothetical protein WICPIJ_010083 [Wickerhamomyces pijperi]
MEPNNSTEPFLDLQEISSKFSMANGINFFTPITQRFQKNRNDLNDVRLEELTQTDRETFESDRNSFTTFWILLVISSITQVTNDVELGQRGNTVTFSQPSDTVSSTTSSRDGWGIKQGLEQLLHVCADLGFEQGHQWSNDFRDGALHLFRRSLKCLQ